MLAKLLEKEVEDASNKILAEQAVFAKKVSKGLVNRLVSQMQNLVKNSLDQHNNEKKHENKETDQVVSSEEIQEFYRYKFNNVSKDITEMVSERVIHNLKTEMSQLQTDIFSTVYYEITESFNNLQENILKNMRKNRFIQEHNL